MQVDNNLEANIILTHGEVQIILNVLGEVPAKISMGIIAKIEQQRRALVNPVDLSLVETKGK